MDLSAPLDVIMLLVSLGMLAAKAIAFLDAIRQPKEAFVAGDKLTKNAWCIILGLALVANLLTRAPINLFNLVGIVAAIVYLVDVRPTLRSLTQR